MKRILSAVAACILAVSAFGQAKKPVIMVVPSDILCERIGCTVKYDNGGLQASYPDYEKAFKSSDELRTMISAVAEFMAQNGFPIQSLEQELKRLKNESVEKGLMTGKEEGGFIEETTIEKLRRNAKADIILNLDYKVTKLGPRRQIEFNLQAVDAYTSKIISGNTGVSSAVSASTPITSILEESVLSFKDNFLSGLQRHFDDLFENGREITVTLMRYDTCPIDFETEFEINDYDVEFADIIEAWFADKCVQGRFTLDSKSANRMRFTQVRMPLYDVNPINGKEVAIDANGFVRSLVRMLKKDPYNLIVGVTPKGLGEVWITLGDK